MKICKKVKRGLGRNKSEAIYCWAWGWGFPSPKQSQLTTGDYFHVELTKRRDISTVRVFRCRKLRSLNGHHHTALLDSNVISKRSLLIHGVREIRKHRSFSTDAPATKPGYYNHPPRGPKRRLLALPKIVPFSRVGRCINAPKITVKKLSNCSEKLKNKITTVAYQT